MDNNAIVALTADIVTAHLGHNRVHIAELPQLIHAVHSGLSQIANREPVASEPGVTPAVSIRSSLRNDSIACLECGGRYKMLKRHLMADHGLEPDEYRNRWGLKFDYPVVAADYSAKRKDLAIKLGLGRRPKDSKVPAPKLQSGSKSSKADTGNG